MEGNTFFNATPFQIILSSKSIYILLLSYFHFSLYLLILNIYRAIHFWLNNTWQIFKLWLFIYIYIQLLFESFVLHRRMFMTKHSNYFITFLKKAHFYYTHLLNKDSILFNFIAHIVKHSVHFIYKDEILRMQHTYQCMITLKFKVNIFMYS